MEIYKGSADLVKNEPIVVKEGGRETILGTTLGLPPTVAEEVCVKEKEGKLQIGWLDRVLYAGSAVEYMSSHTVPAVVSSDHSTKVFSFAVHACPLAGGAAVPGGPEVDAAAINEEVVPDTGGGNPEEDADKTTLEATFSMVNPMATNQAAQTVAQTNVVPAVDTTPQTNPVVDTAG